MILMFAAGCLDRLLEGPLVLAAGLGDARSLAPDGDGAMLVATAEGLVRVDGTGAFTRVGDGPATAVTTHPGRVYTLGAGKLWWDHGSVDAADVIDVLAGFGGEVLLLAADRLDVLDPASGARTTRWNPPAPAHAVALGPDRAVLVVTDHALWRVDDAGATVLVDGLADPRAAATDTAGRVWLVDGEELYRVDAGERTLVARYLGDVRDLHVGTGGLFATENLYLVTGDGTLAYVRPP